MRNPWLNLAMLAVESQQVMLLRMMKFAAGSAKASEYPLMVSEKLAALAEANFKLATGGSSAHVVRGYRRKVRANIRRLRK